jgi:hypothetical protein
MQTRVIKNHIKGNNVTIIQSIQTIRVFQTIGGWDKERDGKKHRVKTARKHLHEQLLQASISMHKVNVTCLKQVKSEYKTIFSNLVDHYHFMS